MKTREYATRKRTRPCPHRYQFDLTEREMRRFRDFLFRIAFDKLTDHDRQDADDFLQYVRLMLD